MISKPVKWMIWFGILFVALVGCVAVLAGIVLPGYVEDRLLPRLSREFGLSPGDLNVRRIGLWGSDIGPVRLSAPDGPAITIATVQIDYTPLGVIRGEIKGVTLGGLGIRLSMTPNGIAIAGLRIPVTSDGRGPDTEGLDLRKIVPIHLDQLSIIQSHLILDWQGRRYRIPMDVDLQTRQLRDGRLTGRAEFAFLGNPIAVTASLDQSADLAHLEMKAPGFQMDGVNPLLPATLPVQLSGRLDVEAGVRLGLRSFDLKGVAISGRSQDIRLTSPHGAVYPVMDDNQSPVPLVFRVSGESLSELKWHFAPFQVGRPVEVTVSEVSGIISRTSGRWSLTGDIKTLLPGQDLSEQIRLASELPVDGQVTVRNDPDQQLTEFNLTTRSGAALMLEMGDRRISSEEQVLRVSGNYSKGAIKGESFYTAEKVKIGAPEGDITLPKVTVSSSIGLPQAGAGDASRLEALVETQNIRATIGTTVVRLPKAHFSLSGNGKSLQALQFDANLRLSNGRVSDNAQAVQIRQLSVDLPLKWPQTKGVKRGRLSAGSIAWRNQPLGAVKGRLQQKDRGLAMALRHTSKLFPGMRVLINGGLDPTGSLLLEATVPRHHLREAIDLGQFQPAAAGLMASGDVEAAARLTFDSGRLDGDARFNLSKGSLQEPGRNLMLEGVNMAIEIDDIVAVQSAPQQKIQVDRLTFGNLKAENLKVDFQLEHPGILFVEKAQIDWSEGKINTAAIRIVPGVDEYDVILFCDRLNLATVLEQLGAAEADGDGTVNGRIPIHWDHGRLSFDNGFLFSSPGQTGAIQLTGTDALLSGLPPGTPQHAQLDIATEALKDYTYKWAKMTVQTEDDVLLLKLQFDGKPNRLLPFAYDQQLGQFKRVAGDGQADFKGISIDLNLRSPLNEIMNYKELLK